MMKTHFFFFQFKLCEQMIIGQKKQFLKLSISSTSSGNKNLYEYVILPIVIALLRAESEVENCEALNFFSRTWGAWNVKRRVVWRGAVFFNKGRNLSFAIFWYYVWNDRRGTRKTWMLSGWVWKHFLFKVWIRVRLAHSFVSCWK